MSERILCPSFFFLLVKIPMILGKRAHFSGAYGLFFFCSWRSHLTISHIGFHGVDTVRVAHPHDSNIPHQMM